MHILIVGATGSVGRHAVAQAQAQGHKVSVLSRSPARAAALSGSPQVIIADVTQPDTLAHQFDDIDAVIFTLGSDGMGKTGAKTIDYGGVRNVLFALRDRRVSLALMTAIGVTNRLGSYNQRTQAHDWKRRAERLVRASGHPYTIVRPGWFDYHARDQHQLHFLQGDRRQAGTSVDGVIARQQIAEVLVSSLTSAAAKGKTFELVAEKGEAQTDREPLFSALVADNPQKNDGVFDVENMPERQEPDEVINDLIQIKHR